MNFYAFVCQFDRIQTTTDSIVLLFHCCLDAPKCSQTQQTFWRRHDHNKVIKHLFIILISHGLKPFFPTVNLVLLHFLKCFNSLSRFWPFAKAKQCVPQKVTFIKMKWGTMFQLCEAKKQSFKQWMYCRIFWAFLILKMSSDTFLFSSFCRTNCCTSLHSPPQDTKVSILLHLCVKTWLRSLS